MRDVAMARRRSGIPPSRRDKGGHGGRESGGGGRGPGTGPNGGGSGGEDGQPGPPGYERKFAEFIRMLAEKKGEVSTVFVHHPAVLGDNYAELVESLSRLAEAELGLRVVKRQPRLRPESGSSPAPREAPGVKRRPLPRPNVSTPETGDDPRKFGEAGVKGMLINPIYAGVADYPRLISEEDWVAAAANVLREDGPEQFLVNLLYVLRRTFGCIEWDGDLPPNAN
jgi:hypothetical protein